VPKTPRLPDSIRDVSPSPTSLFVRGPSTEIHSPCSPRSSAPSSCVDQRSGPSECKCGRAVRRHVRIKPAVRGHRPRPRLPLYLEATEGRAAL
jgi:hypothetical protein